MWIRFVLCDTLSTELIEKATCMKTKNSFIKEKAKDHVLFSKQIRNVNHKMYLGKKQDHLGKHLCGTLTSVGARMLVTIFANVNQTQQLTKTLAT